MANFTQKHQPFIFPCLILLLLLPQTCKSSNWIRIPFPFLSKQSTSEIAAAASTTTREGVRVAASEFSMKPLGSQKGVEKYENALRKTDSPENSCWQNAYRSLFAGCDRILAQEEMRSRLAWMLSDCFHKESGRPDFPNCDPRLSMLSCLKKLDADAHKVYLEYYLETNSICHQLQADAFKTQTERLVTELKRTAEYAEDKLENIEGQAEHLLQSSNRIHHTLTSVNSQTQKVVQTSKDLQDRVTNVQEHLTGVLKHTDAIYEKSIGIAEQSEAIYEKSIGIAETQTQLHEDQMKMKENLNEGITMIHNSYQTLGEEISNLQNEAVGIGNKIIEVGDEMSLKMKNLQSKANDIGNITGVSLDNQKQLLASQSIALEGLHLLTAFQSEALEESRTTLQKLAELGRRQQEELVHRQEQLKRSNDLLIENSKTMLAAQEAFEKKQAGIFLAMDKLFVLHNAILSESRFIKSFIIYSLAIFVIHMFTCTKQTYDVRPRLYMGLCVAFAIEFATMRYGTNYTEQQAWITTLVRFLYVLLASVQLLYAIYTYRDYERRNHLMLQKIFEKVDCLQRNNELSWDTDGEGDIESDKDWSSLLDTNLPEEVDALEDPDYKLPKEVEESSGSSSITKRYNLRNRLRM